VIDPHTYTAAESARGIRFFEADVLPENRAMQAVFAATGWDMTTQRADGAVHLTMTLPGDGR